MCIDFAGNHCSTLRKNEIKPELLRLPLLHLQHFKDYSILECPINVNAISFLPVLIPLSQHRIRCYDRISLFLLALETKHNADSKNKYFPPPLFPSRLTLQGEWGSEVSHLPLSMCAILSGGFQKPLLCQSCPAKLLRHEHPALINGSPSLDPQSQTPAAAAKGETQGDWLHNLSLGHNVALSPLHCHLTWSPHFHSYAS